MSRQLVGRSPDLQRLADEGYDFDIRADLLLVKVPYVRADRSIAYGTLSSELTLAGDRTSTPSTHVVSFVGADPGDLPCDNHGRPLDDLINQRGAIALGGDLVASCTFSHKPNPTYPNYYEKMSTYAAMLLGYAQAIDPAVSATSFPPIPVDEDESVFRYLDSATGRARIGAVTDKIRLRKVVIIGAGGTASYILDAVAKTPVGQIDLYDRDTMLTHNAFRSPGAATLDELNAAPKKVHYLQAKYDAIHRHVIAHPVHVDASNIHELSDADFVFIAIDTGPAKKLIIDALAEFGVPFIDTGMGIYQTGDQLGGLIRTTAGIKGHTHHIFDQGRISFAEQDDDEYDQNIQIAELNMLNAAQAVIKWKKLFGFYTDLEQELSSTYTLDGNHLLNEDAAE
ncbi:MAG: ThiF family adenylyltransferase [Jatrophihabitantaceae bacterium]